MRFVLAAAHKDLLRRLRDPLALLLWLAIPLGVGAMIMLSLGGRGGPQPVARLLVVDHDQSFLSRLLVGSFEQGPAAELIEAELVEETLGRERIQAGEVSALLVVPAGFGQALLEDRPVTLELLTNPAQRVLPGIVEEFLSVLVDAVFYLQRLFAPQLETLRGFSQGKGPSDEQVAALSVGINQMMRNLEQDLLPPRIEVELVRPQPEAETEPTPSVPVAALFLPGIVMMALLFTAQGLSEDVWLERRHGTLRRVMASPRGVGSLLAGKLLASAALIGALVLVVLAVGLPVLGLSLWRLPLALAWATLGGVVFCLVMVLAQLHASSQRNGNVLISAVLFPLLMLGGSFFPSEAMPGWMAAVGRWTPNGWAVERLKDLLLGRAEVSLLALGVAGFLLLAAVLWPWTCRRLERAAAEG